METFQRAGCFVAFVSFSWICGVFGLRFFLQKNFNFSTGVDKAATVVLIIRSLGVEAAALRAVNEIPTPLG